MKTEHIHIKISENDKKQIEVRAKELQLTVAEYLRRLAIVDIEKSKQTYYNYLVQSSSQYFIGETADLKQSLPFFLAK